LTNLNPIFKNFIPNCAQSLKLVTTILVIFFVGAVHGCINLHNILISESGVAKIYDFGLAPKRDRQESSLDPEGQLPQEVGTRIFMSPESLPGRPYSYQVTTYFRLFLNTFFSFY
jgi:serine/threonine protein kinase